MIFSNLAGTMSESFSIGKRGVKLLQGTDAPTSSTIAPIGSLYLMKPPTGPGRVYQFSADNEWTPLSGSTKGTFTTDDLSGGLLTFTHSLADEFVITQVWNDQKRQIVPDAIYPLDADNVVIDLTSYVPISGSWTVKAVR